MIKPFKFFEGELKILNHYNAPYIPLLRTPPGSYYDRIINNSLYGGFRLAELSDRVQEIVRDPNYEPANYIEVNGSFYDSVVINRVRTCMRQRINWRGFECWLAETDGYVRLKILYGIHIGGMFQINYSITRNDNTEEYRVSVPLINLQRRG
jgi:hypothetical protein